MKTNYERFTEKVTFGKGKSCWNWKGSRGGSGYGQFWLGDRTIPAHWFLLEEFPPKGKEACHKCDNRLCVRPSHIFIGTRSENMQDCKSKGRLRPQAGLRSAALVPYQERNMANSEKHGRAKLTNEQVRQIRATTFKFGEKSKLARRLGVDATIISRILKGTSWTYVK